MGSALRKQNVQANKGYSSKERQGSISELADRVDV